MAQDKKPKTLIGRAEVLAFPELGFQGVPARIDTGANTSAIWASNVKLTDKGLEVTFFGKGSELYTGETQIFETFGKTVVANSTGHTETRYKVRLLTEMHGRKIRGTFTLANRSTQVYPVLIGRNVLRGKFVVDVKEGKPLTKAERARSEALKARLNEEEE